MVEPSWPCCKPTHPLFGGPFLHKMGMRLPQEMGDLLQNRWSTVSPTTQKMGMVASMECLTREDVQEENGWLLKDCCVVPC